MNSKTWDECFKQLDILPGSSYIVEQFVLATPGYQAV